jgi:hypothetical protein
MPADPTVNYSDPVGARRDLRAIYWSLVGGIVLVVLKLLYHMLFYFIR